MMVQSDSFLMLCATLNNYDNTIVGSIKEKTDELEILVVEGQNSGLTSSELGAIASSAKNILDKIYSRLESPKIVKGVVDEAMGFSQAHQSEIGRKQSLYISRKYLLHGVIR